MSQLDAKVAAKMKQAARALARSGDYLQVVRAMRNEIKHSNRHKQQRRELDALCNRMESAYSNVNGDVNSPEKLEKLLGSILYDDRKLPALQVAFCDVLIAATR